MSLLPTRLLALLALVPAHAAASGAAAAASAAAGVEASPVTLQGLADFKEKFEQARKVNAKDEMRKLVRTRKDDAVFYVVEVAESIANNPSEIVFERMAAISEAWSAEVRTPFCENMERFFSNLSGPFKTDRRKFMLEYKKLEKAWFENIGGAKDRQVLNQHAAAFKRLAESFTAIGDKYFESNSWQFVALSLDDIHEKGGPDLRGAAEGYKACLEARKAVGLKDKVVTGYEERLRQLEALGYGEAPKEGSPEAAAAAEAAKPFTVQAAAAEPLEPGDLVRPNWFLDDHFVIWHQIYLQGKGSSAAIGRLEGGPQALRTKAAEVLVDVDRDGAGDVELPLRGRPQVISMELGDGDAKRPWSFLAMVGHEQTQYQGIQYNSALQDNSALIFIAPSASMTFDLEGTSVQVIDENMNGEFGDTPGTWAHIGLSEGVYQPEPDSMLIGGGKRAVPYSEFVQVGDQWYQLTPQNGGTSFEVARMSFPVGELKLDFGKGPKPSYVILKGRDRFENLYVDLVGSKKVEVPVGRYTLAYGMVSKGKKLQSIKALMVADSDTKAWDVRPGETTEVELGGPFDLDFDVQLEGDELTVPGQSVVVVGRGGERYERMWNCVLDPDVSWRKAGSGRGSKGEGMGTHGDQDAMQKYGYPAVWFPKDLTLRVKAGEEGVEASLFVKKNKLFGKLQSTWRD